MKYGKARVLVVDDTDAARYSLVRALRGDGHEVIEAENGRRALETARRESLDLMVLDVRLPDINGFEVAEELRADDATKSLAILQISSSYTSADAQAQGLLRGADAYLTHPIEPQVLSATVHALLRMRKAEQHALAERARAEISEQEARTATEQRDRLVVQLRHESRLKNEFLAVLSHELRNPLAPIMNSVHILERASRDGKQGVRAREVIARQVRHMTRLVDDLLDVTRISRGKVSLQREFTDLNGVVRRSIEDHRSSFYQAEVQLLVELPELPLCVNRDATRLSQVVGNLLHNAAKFTPAGGHVTVSLGIECNDQAVLRISDTGAGISPETMNHLFEPFVQGERTLDRSGGGLGLGLALARGIVELHGGSISAFSEGPGRGAAFTVKLPIENRRAPQLVLAPVQDTARGTCRVLIIEDHLDAAESLRDALELSGHVVQISHDAASGLQLARSFAPDVVLCDIGLPCVDGYAVARQMRNDPDLRSLVLVALSGYATQEDREKSFDAGFDEHMAKPPQLDVLDRLLSQAPRRFRAG
jgi:signal transduction histidine kinase